MSFFDTPDGLTKFSVIRLAKLEMLNFLTRDQRGLVQSLGTGRTVEYVISKSGLPSPVAMGLLKDLLSRGVISIVADPETARFSGALSKKKGADAGDFTGGRQDAEGMNLGSFASASGLDEAAKSSLAEMERRLASPDLFALLGIPRGSEAPAVKQAFYGLSRSFHPDCFSGRTDPETLRRIEDIFSRLTQAYATLSDPEQRARYLAQYPQFAFEGRDNKSGIPNAARRTDDPGSGHQSDASPRTDLKKMRRERLLRNPLMMHQKQRANMLREGRQAFLEGNYFIAVMNLEAAKSAGILDAESERFLQEAKENLKKGQH